MTYLAAALLVLASLGDAVTTTAALRRGAREANPLIGWLMQATGRAWPLFKLLPLAPALLAAWHYPHELRLALVLVAMALLYAVVAWRNHRLHR